MNLLCEVCQMQSEKSKQFALWKNELDKTKSISQTKLKV